MVPVPVVLSAISAVLKFGRVAADAYEQQARDQAILIPHSPRSGADFETKVIGLFTGPNRTEVTTGALAAHWENNRWKDDDESRALVFARAKEILAERGDKNISDPSRAELDDYVALKQWGENAGPLPPIARLGIALVDSVATFVSAHPETVGFGSNSARFATALTRSVSDLLPEYEKAEPLTAAEWAKVDFTDQVVLIALRAGLGATRETVDVYIEEEHLRELVLDVTKPLVDGFAAGDLAGYDWDMVRDNLLEPMIRAGVGTVAAHQQAFLGRGFDPNRAVGALSKAFLDEIAAAEGGLVSLLGEPGAIRLYQTSLKVVAERPDLFVGGKSKSDRAARALVQNAAQTLRKADPVWRGDLRTLGGELLVSSVETVVANRALVFSSDDAWQALAGDLFEELAAGMRDGAGGPLENLLARPVDRLMLTALRALLEQAAASPEMITGSEVREDVRKIVAAVAAAMAKDEELLLTAEEWPDIVAVAVYEASRNPGRLFGIDRSDPLADLGTQIISTILSAAYEGLAASDSEQDRFLLFGETLRVVIVMTLQHAAGNARAALANLEPLATLVRNLNAIVSARPDEIGAAEWQALFRRFLNVAIDKGKVDEFTVEILNEIVTLGVRDAAGG